ncbi:MAG: RNA polymerase sigma factor [Lachnospiraceae bacterium]|nr:RNA polymerase sigma factor [Lachnospiraceae bacterium]MDE7285656.1 RNA polymerase sigma factor [Lachnospiraceae bacterium]
MNGKRKSLDNLFIETVGQNKTAMFRLAYSIVLNREDAEDVVSESILKAYSHLSELKNSRKMKAWLFQIIANESKTCLRKRKRVELTEDFSTFLTEKYVPESSFDLLEFVCHLNDGFKEVILLYYFEAFRVKEIAEILAISEGTVKSRLSRARQELKKALEAAQ